MIYITSVMDVLRFVLVALSFKYKKVTKYYFIYEMVCLTLRLMVGNFGIELSSEGVINLYVPLMILVYSQCFWKDLVATMLISPFDKLIVHPVILEEGSPNYSQLG